MLTPRWHGDTIALGADTAAPCGNPIPKLKVFDTRAAALALAAAALTSCGGGADPAAGQTPTQDPPALSALDCSGPGRSGWCWLSPSPRPLRLNDVVQAGTGLGLAAGEFGSIATSADRGASWMLQPAPASRDLVLVRLSASGAAWAVTSGAGLLRSGDAGRSWHAAGTVPLASVSQLWVLGGDRLVADGPKTADAAVSSLVSEDGGQTWRDSVLRGLVGHTAAGALIGRTGASLGVSHDLGRSITAAIPCGDRCQLLGLQLQNDAGLVLITQPDDRSLAWTRHASTDGGRHWTADTYTPPFQAAEPISLFADGTAWARSIESPAGSPGMRRWRSNDGGRRWSILVAEGLAPDSGGGFLDSQSMWVIHADDSAISSDEGRHWRALVVPGESRPPLQLRRAAGGGLLAGFGGTPQTGVDRWYSSADDGQHWVALPGGQRSQPVDDPIVGLWFSSATQGLALRQNDGQPSRSDDGGRTWVPSGSGIVAPQWLDLAVTADGTAWAIGRSLARSTDAGRSWTFLSPVLGMGHRIVDGQFLDADNGWLMVQECRNGGDETGPCERALYRTHDGGRTLRRLFGAGAGARARFADAQRGVMMRGDGTILRSSDGGQTWQAADSAVAGAGAALRIHFSSADEVWMLPADPAAPVIRSSDAGRTWRSAGLPEGARHLTDIRFAPGARSGWIVGQAGLVLYTGDGGTTWSRQTAPTERDFTRIVALDAGRAWIGTADGGVITTTSGGR